MRIADGVWGRRAESAWRVRSRAAAGRDYEPRGCRPRSTPAPLALKLGGAVEARPKDDNPFGRTRASFYVDCETFGEVFWWFLKRFLCGDGVTYEIIFFLSFFIVIF